MMSTDKKNLKYLRILESSLVTFLGSWTQENRMKAFEHLDSFVKNHEGASVVKLAAAQFILELADCHKEIENLGPALTVLGHKSLLAFDNVTMANDIFDGKKILIELDKVTEPEKQQTHLLLEIKSSQEKLLNLCAWIRDELDRLLDMAALAVETRTLFLERTFLIGRAATFSKRIERITEKAVEIFAKDSEEKAFDYLDRIFEYGSDFIEGVRLLKHLKKGALLKLDTSTGGAHEMLKAFELYQSQKMFFVELKNAIKEAEEDLRIESVKMILMLEKVTGIKSEL